tara:strand:- start:75 stop:377 length:303 start_codon:yes stop_codon:yes gene_type:complete
MMLTQQQLESKGIMEAQHGNPTKQVQLENIEKNLLQLNLDKDKYKGEFDKIPESAKTIAQRRRKEFLEGELKLISKNIGGLKQKLRDMGELGTTMPAQYR